MIRMMDRGIDVLHPSYSNFQNSNWLFEESKNPRWTPEENKRFEKALAHYDKDTPERWIEVAAAIPGKTVADVIRKYKELEKDVCYIEAGLIPSPGYGSGSFTLDWGCGDDDHGIINHGIDGLGQYLSGCGKRSTGTRHPEHERKKGVPWTEEEHRQFLMGLKKYGKGDWRNISRNFVTTRTPTQVASHAQKYFIRQLTGAKDKRRSSIHDITTVNVPDVDTTCSPSNCSTKSVMQPGSSPKAALFGAKPSALAAPSCDLFINSVSSYCPKIEHQDLIAGNQSMSQFEHHIAYL